MWNWEEGGCTVCIPLGRSFPPMLFCVSVYSSMFVFKQQKATGDGPIDLAPQPIMVYRTIETVCSQFSIPTLVMFHSLSVCPYLLLYLTIVSQLLMLWIVEQEMIVNYDSEVQRRKRR
jgi:hypothetical protein